MQRPFYYDGSSFILYKRFYPLPPLRSSADSFPIFGDIDSDLALALAEEDFLRSSPFYIRNRFLVFILHFVVRFLFFSLHWSLRCLFFSIPFSLRCPFFSFFAANSFFSLAFCAANTAFPLSFSANYSLSLAFISADVFFFFSLFLSGESSCLRLCSGI